jgi:hypothetical protein
VIPHQDVVEKSTPADLAVSKPRHEWASSDAVRSHRPPDVCSTSSCASTGNLTPTETSTPNQSASQFAFQPTPSESESTASTSPHAHLLQQTTSVLLAPESSTASVSGPVPTSFQTTPQAAVSVCAAHTEISMPFQRSPSIARNAGAPAPSSLQGRTPQRTPSGSCQQVGSGTSSGSSIRAPSNPSVWSVQPGCRSQADYPCCQAEPVPAAGALGHPEHHMVTGKPEESDDQAPPAVSGPESESRCTLSDDQFKFLRHWVEHDAATAGRHPLTLRQQAEVWLACVCSCCSWQF